MNPPVGWTGRLGFIFGSLPPAGKGRGAEHPSFLPISLLIQRSDGLHHTYQAMAGIYSADNKEFVRAFQHSAKSGRGRRSQLGRNHDPHREEDARCLVGCIRSCAARSLIRIFDLFATLPGAFSALRPPTHSRMVFGSGVWGRLSCLPPWVGNQRSLTSPLHCSALGEQGGRGRKIQAPDGRCWQQMHGPGL